MKLQSLGYRTDLIFSKFDGEILDRGNYLVVRTFSNPNFFWGNLLIFDRPPGSGDVDEWQRLFKKEFTDPRIYHVTLAWDSPAGDQGEALAFVHQGYDFEESTVLSTSSIHVPPKMNPAVEVRPFTTEQDWATSIKLQLEAACLIETKLSRQQWEEFYRSQAERYKKMIKAGRGQWFGAYLNGRMAGSLGLFHEGDLGRFQSVATHPDCLRQGVCSTLVYHVAKHGLESWGLKTLVMVADPNYHAARIYESVGFQPREKTVGVCWWDHARG